MADGGGGGGGRGTGESDGICCGCCHLRAQVPPDPSSWQIQLISKYHPHLQILYSVQRLPEWLGIRQPKKKQKTS